MLYYTKSVLKKVSFNATLFCKELEKAYRVLLPHEFEELTKWLMKFVVKKPELQHCVYKINS